MTGDLTVMNQKCFICKGNCHVEKKTGKADFSTVRIGKQGAVPIHLHHTGVASVIDHDPEEVTADEVFTRR